ncbi:MAG: site-2 protease family protein [Candidatus Borkfalkiaceae bacterium]|nr:site-2 protease family protein [Christensenellaceae bacterium]
MSANLILNLNLSGVFGTILSIAEALLILLFMITVHEFGHYIVAKIFDFRVNEFAIGMGPALYKKTRKNGEIFSVRLLPLGGYCAFEGEDEDNADPRAFNNKKPWQRLLVLVAGATMNFLSAIVIFSIAFGAYGQMCMQAFEIKEPTALTMQSGDVILNLNGKDIYLSTDLAEALNGKKKGDMVTAQVLRDGERKNIEIQLKDDPSSSNLQDYNGVFKSLSVATIVGVESSLDNEKSRVISGDYLLRYSYEKPEFFDAELSEKEEIEYYGCVVYTADGKRENYSISEKYYTGTARSYSKDELKTAVNGLKTGDNLYLFVSRVNAETNAAERVMITVSANAAVDYSAFSEEECLKFLNISSVQAQWRVNYEEVRFGFFENIGRAIVYSFKNCAVSLRALGQILTGKLSISSMSGTIGTIALTSQVASRGFRYVLEMAGIIGVSLAVFNLLPIPALDGARAVFVIIEWIRKKPFSRKVEGTIHAVGLIVLLLFSLSIDLIKLFI